MNLTEEIKKLKKEKNAVILAHSYQKPEIDEVADFTGDSLYLSQQAAKTNADIILFAGVYFMAEVAKILSPNKKVLLPNKHAGCKMADMINLKQIKDFKSQHKNLPVVCYINSSAEVKSEADICCTSSNALKIVSSLNSKQVLFVPDKNLGAWVENQLKDIEVITYDGNCPIHQAISIKDVENRKKEYPHAKVLVHPECKKEVCDLADFVGSTTQIINYTKQSNTKEFIIVTEQGVVDRLKRDDKNRTYIPINSKTICPDMKCTTLEDIYNALKNEEFEIKVDKELAKSAINCINRMLEVSK